MIIIGSRIGNVVTGCWLLEYYQFTYKGDEVEQFNSDLKFLEDLLYNQ